VTSVRGSQAVRAATVGLVLAVALAFVAPGIATADSTGPVVTTKTPADGASVTAPVTLTAHISDADLIDDARTVFLVDGAVATPTVTYGGYWEGTGCDTYWVDDFSVADLSATLPTLSYGPHTITVKAYDRLGNLSLTPWTIDGQTFVTFSNPLPAAGSRSVSASHVEVSLTGPGISAPTVAMAIDGTTVTATYAPIDSNHGRCYYDGTLADGTHTVRVVASDGAAPLSQTTWSFDVNHTFTGPVLSGLTPADEAVVQGPFSVGIHAASALLVNGAGSVLLVDGVPQAPSAVTYPQVWVGTGCDTYLTDDRT
jgi:hypothetical protein